MVLAKGSRKGKKAWRRNIDTQDVERALQEDVQRQRQSEPSARDLPDSKLFFIDQAPSEVKVPRRALKSRQPKLLHSQTIIQAPQNARPIKVGPNKRKGTALQAQLKRAALVSSSASPEAGAPEADSDAWAGELPAAARKRAKLRQPPTALSAAAVQLDAPGSSYNPDHAQHEDAVADAVAAEVSKANALLLRAKPPPKSSLFSHSFDDDLAMLQVTEDIEVDGDDSPDPAEEGTVRSRSQPQRKTQADRNKEERLRKENQALAERRAQKQKKQDLAALSALQAQINEAEAEHQLRRRRRAAIRAEHAASEPARLGKHKYMPMPTQVLLSEELGTGLRGMRAAPVLVKDRFKALQRRGLIETRLPVRGRRPGKRIAYQPGDRADRAAASQAELDSLRRTGKQ